jgi:hypothetical protein
MLCQIKTWCVGNPLDRCDSNAPPAPFGRGRETVTSGEPGLINDYFLWFSKRNLRPSFGDRLSTGWGETGSFGAGKEVAVPVL